MAAISPTKNRLGLIRRVFNRIAFNVVKMIINVRYTGV